MVYRIVLPILLLGLSAAFSFVSAIALRNHQTLSDAVGPSSFARPRSRTSAPSVLDLVGNPFTLTVLIFSIGLLTSAFVIPRSVGRLSRQKHFADVLRIAVPNSLRWTRSWRYCSRSLCSTSHTRQRLRLAKSSSRPRRLRTPRK